MLSAFMVHDCQPRNPQSAKFCDHDKGSASPNYEARMYEQGLLKPKAAGADKPPEIEIVSLMNNGDGDA